MHADEYKCCKDEQIEFSKCFQKLFMEKTVAVYTSNCQLPLIFFFEPDILEQ